MIALGNALAMTRKEYIDKCVETAANAEDSRTPGWKFPPEQVREWAEREWDLVNDGHGSTQG